MLKRNLKIISALALVASIGTGFTTVNAASLSNKTTKAAYCSSKNFNTKNNENFLKTKLDSLVTAGTITQDQETAALNLLTSSKTDKKSNTENLLKTKLDTLVTAGTITKDQETAIKNLLTSNKNADVQAKKEKFTSLLKTKLDTLVTAGTITQDQETAMINSLTSSTSKNAES